SHAPVLLTFILPVVGSIACGSSPPPAPPPVNAANMSGAAVAPGAPAPPPVVTAAAPPPAPRTAAAILADALAAIGGEAAWNAHTTMRIKFEMTFQGKGISGTVERLSTRGDKGKPDRL